MLSTYSLLTIILISVGVSISAQACESSEPDSEYVQMLTSRSSYGRGGYITCQREIREFNSSCQKGPIVSSRLDRKIRTLRRKIATSTGKRRLLAKSQLYLLDRNHARKLKNRCTKYLKRIKKSCQPVIAKYKEYLNGKTDLSCNTATDREIMAQMQSLQSNYVENRMQAMSFIGRMNRAAYKAHQSAYKLQQQTTTTIAAQ